MLIIIRYTKNSLYKKNFQEYSLVFCNCIKSYINTGSCEALINKYIKTIKSELSINQKRIKLLRQKRCIDDVNLPYR